MLQTFSQATSHAAPTPISYAASPFVPMLVNPRADDTYARPLYGPEDLGESTAGSIFAMVLGSVFAAAIAGTAFHVYKRTESPMWAGAAYGGGALALGLLAVGLGAGSRTLQP